MPDPPAPHTDWAALAIDIKRWARELGFAKAGIADTGLGEAAAGLAAYLAHGHHGDMAWLAERASMRADPASLLPGTIRVISLRMDYAPPDIRQAWDVVHDGELGYISRYALGRDYHKLVRKRVQKLADRIVAAIGPFRYRALCDSAPVFEKPLAQKAGLGWRGKHTLTLSREAGSYFFLGELYTDLPLPLDAPVSDHCGSCTRCIELCPTGAIVAPYQLDARRCISYLTIEHRGPVEEALRPLLGNRVYGCDDCLAVCPWNKFARTAHETGYAARVGAPPLAELARLDDAAFRERFSGSPVKRIGRDRFVRNVLYAIGNSGDRGLRGAAAALVGDPDPAVADAARWALARLAG